MRPEVSNKYMRHTAKTPIGEGGDESQFLWAVSYSDMLMVLLSFFVIYYNTSETKVTPPPQEALQKIAVEVTKTSPTAVPADVSKSVEILAQEPVLLKNVADRLNPDQLKWVDSENHQTLTIYMPDNAYEVGSFELKGRHRAEFIHMIGIIQKVQKEQAGHIAVSVTGHNDDIPISMRNETPIVSSNAVLAGLRATKAADFAVFLGLNRNYVKAESQQESARSTRSLTIRLMEVK